MILRLESKRIMKSLNRKSAIALLAVVALSVYILCSEDSGWHTEHASACSGIVSISLGILIGTALFRFIRDRLDFQHTRMRLLPALIACSLAGGAGFFVGWLLIAPICNSLPFKPNTTMGDFFNLSMVTTQICAFAGLVFGAGPGQPSHSPYPKRGRVT